MDSRSNTELLQEAERLLVRRKFRLSCAKTLNVLTRIVTDGTNTCNDDSDVLNVLSNLQAIYQSKDDILAEKCIAVIMQCLYELDRQEEAIEVLSRFYGDFSDSPSSLQILHIQLLAHTNRLDQAQEHLKDVHDKNIEQELKKYILHKQSIKQKPDLVEDEAIHSPEDEMIPYDLIQNLTVKPTASEIQPPKKLESSSHSLSEKYEKFRSQLIQSPWLNRAKIISLILAALLLCSLLLRILTQNKYIFNDLKIKAVQSIQDAVKMA
ncbi:hypothetical protein AKO1_005821, partial [Acrasis kona]